MKQLFETQKKVIQMMKVVFLFILFSLLIILFNFFKTFSNIIEPSEFLNYDKWDGITISDTLEGTGTTEDPFFIYSASDFMYAKELMQQENYNSHFVLMNNLDFQEHVITTIGTVDNFFEGNFDGNGYSIANLSISGLEINDTLYNGLFARLKNATIQNLNLKNINIQIPEMTAISGTIAGAAYEQTNIKNIGIYNTTTGVKSTDIFGGIIGIQNDSTNLNGIYVNLGTPLLNNNNFGTIVGTQNNTQVSSVNNIIIYMQNGNPFGTCVNCSTYNNMYIYDQNIMSYQYDESTLSFVTNETELELNNLATLLTDNINDAFTWLIEDNYLRFDNMTNVEINTMALPIPIENTIAVHDSGVDNNIVYINELEADWNYYQGRNYNESNTGILPTGENQNLYNEKTLIKIAIHYKGTDLDNNALIGYLGPDEQYSEMVYYKYYPVKNNKVKIELIDNPFADLPNNMAFNGWISNIENAKFIYSKDYYTRYLELPVTFSDEIPLPMEITVYADWTNAKIGHVNGNWTNAFSELDDEGFYEFGGVNYIYEDPSNYYIRDTVARYSYYPTGAVNNRGNSVSGRCYTRNGCTYYIHPDVYEEGVTYYALQNGQMATYTPQIVGTEENETLDLDFPIAGYYRSILIANGSSIAGYYDEDANYIESGNCSSASGCTYYELIPYFDADGQLEVSVEGETYYKLVTRDTNIVVLESDMETAWSTNKPFTLTGYYNDIDNTDSELDVSGESFVAGNDLRIENITINGDQTLNYVRDPSSSATSARYLYGNYFNVKIGRGIKRTGTNVTFTGVIGGNNSTAAIGSSGEPVKYRLIVESGWYNTITLINGPITTSGNKYVESQGIYGNDYDKILEENDNLEVYYDAAGAWGGVYYSSGEDKPIFDVRVLSGEFGTSEDDYTTGIYVGGRSYGSHNNLRRIKVEGGWIYNLIGGPIVASSRAGYNDTDISVTGGEVDVIIGGAGTSATYGNRLIQVTGGRVNYSVFGGSNGYNGSGDDGTVNGSSFIYIGGDAEIGNPTYVNANTRLWNAEAGSVFGIGNGRTGNNYTAIGSNDNSNIIIDGDAVIHRNVYGGGNYGATGISSNSSTTTTQIRVLDGTIEGSLYGGGNNNGSGSNSKSSTINIYMQGGTINGSLYGGSNQLGIIYGNVNINVVGGEILNSIYGGGQGGYSGTSNGTFVSGNVNVIVGNRTSETDVIVRDSVYGGSAYGSVNGTTRTTNVSSSTTTVTINDGTIQNVYGGGEGSDIYTPYVMGNITVNINGGNITNVFGGNDAAGVPNGSIDVYLNDGIITNAFGGGNNAFVNSSNIYLQGANVTSLYGGGNNAGATNTNVILVNGEVTNAFGGSNQSGDVTTSTIVSGEPSGIVGDVDLNVSFSGNDINIPESQYLSLIDITGVIKNTTPTNFVRIEGVIEASNSTLNTNISEFNILSNNGEYEFSSSGLNIASNSESTFTFKVNSYVPIKDFKILNFTITAYDAEGNSYTMPIVQNLYGGNNDGGTTGNTNIDLEGITVFNLYGGGNNATVTGNTDVNLNNCNLKNDVYGGGNNAVVQGNTNISVISSEIMGTLFGGGNAGNVNGNSTVIANSVKINESLYGGGNSADIIGNTIVTVDGNTSIEDSLFGGGNSGAIGTTENDSSSTIVNLSGGIIGKNVYGGCNTSVVYGTTDVNIGKDAVTGIDNVVQAPIHVKGTVFGGGEANASGSEVYDFSFISVTKGIDIVIDGSGYGTEDIEINGSIFGSGNASSSSGISNILIRKLGSSNIPNRAISIQRANSVVIDNSVIELTGTEDRTNEYSDYKYSFNRIDLLKIKNNTRILLHENANLLKEFQSLVDINGEEIPASVQIEEDGTTTKNVDNRVYVTANTKLNISTNEAGTAYGKVTGMSLFGMYNSYGAGSYIYGIYNMENNQEADAGDIIVGSSYVIGLHDINMDYYVDGFYTNYINEENTYVTTNYIIPTPPVGNHYMWAIGIKAIDYPITLTASKYASLGTKELSLVDFGNGNTTFEILGFNSEGLVSGVSLIDSNDVPKIAATPEEANSVLGLAIKSETTEWVSHDTTKFLSQNNGTIVGTNSYTTDNQATAPSLTVYLYHAKNITVEEDLGTVVISMQAKQKSNEIEYDVSLITITIDISAKTFIDQTAYDASITYGRKYEMPAITDVNITNKSEFTAYYSLYEIAQSYTAIYGQNNDYYRTLVSNFAFPANTKITMIDFGQEENKPKYYYLQVDDNMYQNKANQLANDGEATYDLSDFIAMDSISNNNVYDNASANISYFHDDIDLVMEEFIFIFDFEDSGITGEKLNNSVILELRTSEDRTSVTVLGIRQSLMVYNLYEASNVVLQSEMNLSDNYFHHDIPKTIGYNVTVGYDVTSNLESVIDTNYESNSMGINIKFKDSSYNLMSSSMLVGTSVIIDGVTYFPSSDGVFRIKLSNKVSNLSKDLIFTLGQKMPSGNYNIEIDLFSSSDGMFATEIDKTDIISIVLVGSNNSFNTEIADYSKIIDGNTGLNLVGQNKLRFTFEYVSQLNSPNIRVVTFLRNKDSYNTLEYTEIDLQSLVTTQLLPLAENNFTSSYNHEYLISKTPNNNFAYELLLNEVVESGTYKFVFKLYDGNQEIDQNEEYVIVKTFSK